MTDQKENQTFTRDELRAQIFSSENTTSKRIPIIFNGANLELKQPTIEQVMSLNEINGNVSRLIHTLTNFAVIPGTDETVLEEGDLEVLKTMPFTPEMFEIQRIITNFLIGDVKAAEKN